MNELYNFSQNSVYNLRSGSQLETRNINTVHFGCESTVTLGSKIWKLIPNNIKNSESLAEFKAKIKKWVPKACPCRLCKIYVGQVGFIDYSQRRSSRYSGL